MLMVTGDLYIQNSRLLQSQSCGGDPVIKVPCPPQMWATYLQVFLGWPNQVGEQGTEHKCRAVEAALGGGSSYLDLWNP